MENAEARVNVILGTMTFGGQTSRDEAREQLQIFFSRGHRSIDTARMYCHGKTEEILGDILERESELSSTLQVASKANAFKGYNENLTAENVAAQSDSILAALKIDQTDIFYLHAPDVNTPIEETLAAVQRLYEAKRFRRFGLSNYAAWEVAYIHGYCKANNWVIPTVYQGMYNAVTRDVERELFPALRKLGMSFYAYNPLCGGLLTGKHSQFASESEEDASRGTRFDAGNQLYRGRYWKEEYFAAIEMVRKACEDVEGSSGSPALLADCSIRWLVHHSQLSAERGDGLIVGASSIKHLIANLDSCEAGALPESVVSAFDEAWRISKPACEKYFRP